MTWLARLRGHRRRDLELAQEIQGHLDEKIEDLVESGLTRGEAALAARRAFGNVTLANERGRAVWHWPSADTWWVDARYAYRQLYKRPASTLVAVLSAALGIGVTTAACAALYAVLIDPYPYRDLGRLVHLHVFDASGFLFDLPLSSQQFQEFERSPVVDGAMAMDVEAMAATEGDLPESVNAGYLSPTAFAFLGVPPLLGRVLSADDALNPSNPRHVVVLSYRYWQSHLGGDPDIVGQALHLDHQSYEIIGVMPRRFAWWDCDVYLPLRRSADPDRLATVFARLPPGVDDARAEQSLQSLVETLTKERPDRFPAQFQIRVLHMREIAEGQSSGTLRVMGLAVGFLLMIACANVSILLLARGTTKTPELAIRVALGASRGRLIRQLLVESLLISLGGGLAGVLGAYWMVDLLPRLLPADALPAESVIQVSGPILLVSAAVAVLAGVLSGLWPALRVSRPALHAIMRGGWHEVRGSRGPRRSHNLLIAGQVALTIVLLAGAAAAGRALTALLHATLNYEPRDVASIRVDLRDGTYGEWDERVRFYDRIREAAAATPGMRSVALSLSDLPPATPFHSSTVEIPGRSVPERQAAFVVEVSQEYFSTLGLAMLRGRSWDASETRHAARVAVINVAMARRFWPGNDPLRQWVHLPDLRATTTWALAAPENDGWVQIVGVAADTPNSGLSEPVVPAIYVPYTLVVGDSFRLIARTAGPLLLPLVRTVAEEIRSIDPDQPINQVRTATELLDAQGWARERFSTSLFTALALAALLLSAAGLYSVVTYVVAEKRHEFSIRVALGARRIDVVRMVVGSALEPTAVGVAIGLGLSLAGSAALTRWTQASLRDPYVLAPAVAALLCVATVAAFIPAYRAASVDPMRGLRSE